MKHKLVLHTVGILLMVFSGLMLLPLLVSLYYGEPVLHFIISAAISAVSGTLLFLIKPEDIRLMAREGFVIVALGWILLSAVGALPFFVICLVFAIVAQKQRFSLGVLPSWVASYESQSEVSEALAFYHETSGLSLEAVLRIVVRLIIFPYVTMMDINSYEAMYWVDKLSPLFCLTLPACYAVGYLRGPFLRALVHGNIRQNRRKHNKREKRARQQRRQQMETKNNKKELI